MLKLLITTSCLLAVCQGMMQTPQMSMAAAMAGMGMPGAASMAGMGMPGAASMAGMGMPGAATMPRMFGRFAMNFNPYMKPRATLKQMCNSALMQRGGRPGDYLSDIMSQGVNFMMTHQPGSRINPMNMVKGPGMKQWECLMRASQAKRGGIANALGDYFDTVVEHPVRHIIEGMGMHFNPCETVFCGERGMTPFAAMNTIMRNLRMGNSLGQLGSLIFGSKVSMFDSFRSNPRATSRMGTASRWGQPGTASNPMGQPGTASNAMGQPGTSSNGLVPKSTTGTASNAMGQPGTSSAAAGSQSGGLDPLSQMMSSLGQGAGGSPMTNMWKNVAGSGSSAAAAPRTGSGNMWQQVMSMMGGQKPASPAVNTNTAPSGNPMMDRWKQMATSLTGTGSNAAATGSGGNMWQQMMGGGLSPVAPAMPNTAAAPAAYTNAAASPATTTTSSAVQNPTTTVASTPAPAPAPAPASSPSSPSAAWGVSGMAGGGGVGGMMARLLNANPRMKAFMQAFSAMSGGRAGSPLQGGLLPPTPTPTTTTTSTTTTTTTTQKPAAPPVSSAATGVIGNQGAAGMAGMGTLNNIMGMMFAHQAMQDAPDAPPMRGHGMMRHGAMGSPAGMPGFNMFGGAGGARGGPPMGAQQAGGFSGMGNTGGLGMLGDVFRMMG